jgi:predicted small secreted protein
MPISIAMTADPVPVWSAAAVHLDYVRRRGDLVRVTPAVTPCDGDGVANEIATIALLALMLAGAASLLSARNTMEGVCQTFRTVGKPSKTAPTVTSNDTWFAGHDCLRATAGILLVARTATDGEFSRWL